MTTNVATVMKLPGAGDDVATARAASPSPIGKVRLAQNLGLAWAAP